MASITMNLETLDEHFKNNLKLDTQSQFIVQKCGQNKNLLCVQAENKNSRSKKQYIFTMVLNQENLNKKKTEYSKVLENVCAVRYENDVYFGFEKKGIKSPVKNSLDNLKMILKHLAEFQVTTYTEIKSNRYEVKKIADAPIGLSYFKDFDNDNVSDFIVKLHKTAEELTKDGFLVKSIANFQASNVFITPSNTVVFLDLDQEVFQSPVYDALMYIFALSDEKFRQHYLKILLNDYYQNLAQFVQKLNPNSLKSFNQGVFESHVKIFLHIVKFENILFLSQLNKTSEEQQDLKELLNNVSYCLKYQLVSYEDCLEAISRKKRSTDFELVDYQLVPLDEKSGHLGNYFNLISKINCFDKFEEYNMFVKSFNTDNEHVNLIVQSGPSKKEQFFYRTLIPLFRQYGLGSLLDFSPECYFDRLNDVIILENLTVLDYKPFRPDVKLGYDIFKTVYNNLAKYHACSILLEKRMSKEKGTAIQLGNIYKEFMVDWLFVAPKGSTETIISLGNSKPGIEAFIDYFEDMPNISKEEFKRRVNEFYSVFLEIVNKPSKRFQNVICHGDLYSSNMLVKFDQNGVAKDCVLIDFQALRYAPIAQDILMVAYLSAHKEIRDEYLDQLLEEYYQELKNILSKFDCDINSVYTFEDFLESVNIMRPAAIVAALCYCQIIAVPRDKMEEILFNQEKYNYYILKNRKEFIKYAMTLTGDYKKYVKDLLEDLYDILCQ